MFLSRSAMTVARRAAVAPIMRRTFATTMIRREAPAGVPEKATEPKTQTLADIKSAADLFGPGAKPGEVPTDLEQSTGLERLEILGKMEDVDIFDMRPLDASRKGTLDNPILVRSAGDEQYAGCTGYPADSHIVNWITMSRDRPIGRCIECGGVYKMEYIGPADDHHHDHHHHDHDDGHPKLEEPKTFANFVKPEYW